MIYLWRYGVVELWSPATTDKGALIIKIFVWE